MDSALETARHQRRRFHHRQCQDPTFSPLLLEVSQSELAERLRGPRTSIHLSRVQRKIPHLKLASPLVCMSAPSPRASNKSLVRNVSQNANKSVLRIRTNCYEETQKHPNNSATPNLAFMLPAERPGEKYLTEAMMTRNFRTKYLPLAAITKSRVN